MVERVGYCVVVASEGIRDADGRFVADAGGGKDAFGHTQLGGVASLLAGRVKDTLGYKVHWTLPDYLQRSARHLASKTDLEQAQAVGKAAVEYALKGMNAMMPVILRTSIRRTAGRSSRHRCEEIANHEKKMPPSFHPQGRLRHHPCRAPLPRAADPGRGTAAVRARRHADVRRAQEPAGSAQAAELAGGTNRFRTCSPTWARRGRRPVRKVEIR